MTRIDRRMALKRLAGLTAYASASFAAPPASAQESRPRYKDPSAPVEERAAVIVNLRSALTDILLKAATTRNIALDEERALIIQAQRDALRSAFGRLLELTALEPIVRLLTKKEIEDIAGELAEARKGIRQKKTAKLILNTVVDATILASKIAVKLAV